MPAPQTKYIGRYPLEDTSLQDRQLLVNGHTLNFEKGNSSLHLNRSWSNGNELDVCLEPGARRFLDAPVYYLLKIHGEGLAYRFADDRGIPFSQYAYDALLKTVWCGSISTIDFEACQISVEGEPTAELQLSAKQVGYIRHYQWGSGDKVSFLAGNAHFLRNNTRGNTSLMLGID